MFLGNGQFLQIYLDMPCWDLLLCWGVEVSDLEGSVWLFCILVVGFFCCTNFFFWRLTAQLSSTMPSLAHDGSPRIAGPGVSAMYHCVCRQFATFCPLWGPVYCCIQCSKLGYLGSFVSCQVCCGWLQSSWWNISVDTSGEQLGKCMQWHDITTCTGVNLALESHKLIWVQFQLGSGQSQRPL